MADQIKRLVEPIKRQKRFGDKIQPMTSKISSEYDIEDPFQNHYCENDSEDPCNQSKTQKISISTPKNYEMRDDNPYSIREGFLVAKDGASKKYNVIGRRIEIVQVLRNIDTGELITVLEFDTVDGTKRIELSRAKLTRQKISDLLIYGADVLDHQIKHVLIHLGYQERNSKVKLVHDQVGWGSYEERIIFKHASALGCSSTYRGKLLIAPQGSFEQWLEIIEEQVMGHAPLELALILGLSAPIVPLIAKETGLEVLLFHIFGDSTRGKTTATMVATSPFGFPHTRTNGLIKTWNGTKNAIIGHFRNNHGIPMGLDEASMNGGDDFSSFIYLLAGGRDKDRLNKEGEMVNTAQWSTTIISNAEHSLLDKSNQNIGIQMRLLEIGNIFWTKSADNADALKEGLLKNYGHAGPAFVQYLMELGPEKIVEKWEIQRREIFESMQKKDQFSQRIANKLAIVILTARLAKEALKLDFDVDTIQALLFESENASVDNRDIGENAYSAFIEAFARFHSRFSTDSFQETGYELWGKQVKAIGKSMEIYLLPDKFKEIMKDAGFDDVKVILDSWRNKSLLDCDKDKFTRKKILNQGVSQRVYVIRVRDGLTVPDGIKTVTGKIQRPRKIIPMERSERRTENLE